MKKVLNISLLTLVALSLSLSSCKNEMDDIFGDDAVIRMSDAMAEYTDILTSNGGKWVMEYYCNPDEPGYVYLMTFKEDGTVVISGHNKWINYIKTNALTASSFGSDWSMWEVIGDNGLTLSFNTYNPYFHLFADPYNLPNMGGAMTDGDTNQAGYGHKGDYEFNLMKYSGDTIYLTGKKYDHHMIMTRISSTIDDETYLNEVAYQNKNMFTSKLPYVFMVLPDGNRWVLKSATTGNMKMYSEREDEITTSEFHNFIITHDGMAFMYPVTLDGYTIQRFEQQPDGSLLSKEDGQTRIIADPLVLCLTNTMLTWKCDAKNQLGGEYVNLVNQINTELKAYDKSSLSDMQIFYDSDLAKYVLAFTIKKGSAKPSARYYFSFTSSGDTQMKLNFDGECNTYGDRYGNACPSIKDFINALSASTVNLSAASLLAPVAITIADSGNANNYTAWSLQ